MKRILPAVMAIVLILCLSGCSLQGQLEDQRPTEPTAPAQALNSLLDGLAGPLSFAVHTTDGDVSGPYQVEELPELGTAMGRPVEQPSGLSRYKHWLVVSAADGDAVLTVYVGDRDILCLESDGNREYYVDESGSLARSLRQIFDELEYASAELRVLPPLSGAAVALREFASSAYPEVRKNLAPGSIYRFRDYDLFDYDLTEYTDSTLTGSIVYAVLPDTADSPIYDQGELLDDPGYEGYVLVTETVRLERHDDGYWYRITETDPAE